MKQEKSNHHFIKAAKQLVERMKTPSNFLQFLTDAINWVSERRDINEAEAGKLKDIQWYYIEHINQLVQRWITCTDKNTLIDNLALGMDDLRDTIGAMGQEECVANAMIGFGKELEHSKFPTEMIERYTQGINTLVDMSVCFTAYEYDNKKAA